MVNRKYIVFGIVLFSLVLSGLNAGKKVKEENNTKISSVNIKKVTPSEIQKIRSIEVLKEHEEVAVTQETNGASTDKTLISQDNAETNPSMFVSQKHLKKIKEKKLKKEKVAKEPKVKNYKENEVIVLIKKNKEYQALNKLKKDKNLIILKKFKLKTKVGEKIFLYMRDKSLSTDKLMKKLKGIYEIESVSPNYIYQFDTTSDDTGSQYQWGFHNTGQGFPPYHWLTGTVDADIDALEAWDIRTDSTSVVAAVIDTGVDYNNEDLTGNMWVNPDEVPNDGLDNDGNGFIDDYYGVNTASNRNGQAEGDPMDVDGHGTHVAGSVGAKGNNAKGVSGVNWDVDVMAVNAYMPGEGFYSDDLLEAVQYVLDAKADGINVVVVNASYGGGGGSQGDTMAQAIASLGDAGIIFVAAAGNDGVDNDATPHYPSSYDEANIIAVANTDYDDAYAASSCYGVTSVDVSAPGSYILSTKWSGGSMAPHEVDEQWHQSQEGGWSHGGTNDNWSLVTKDIVYFAGSNKCWSDSSGTYSPNTNATLDSPVFDLSDPVGSDLNLFFYITGSIADPNDYLAIEYWNSSTNSWDHQASYNGDLSTGIYGIQRSIDPAYYNADFRVRFRMVSDGDGDVDDGFYIDDVSVGSGTYRVISGTSMASPHVTGAVAMLAAEFPDENITIRKDRILVSVDPLPVTGKTVTDGRLNLYNALQNPALVDIAPQYGMTADQVIRLNGHSFGDVTGKVEFVDEGNNIVEATVLEWHDTWIDAQIPSGYPGKKIKVARSINSKSGYINGSRWKEDVALPANIDSASAVAYNGKIYLFGGQADFTVSSAVRIYDTSALTWSTGTPMLTARAYSTASLIGDKVYVIGGYTPGEGVRDAVEVYDISENSWTTAAPLITPRAFAASATIADEIYVSGGTADGKSAENTLYAYDSISDSWSIKSSLGTNKSAHGMIAYNSKLYLFGGSDWDYTTGADYSASHEMWIYDPSTNLWSAGTNMPLGLGTVRFGYAFGSENGDSVIKLSGGNRGQWWWSDKEQTVMTYNFTSDQWYQTNEGLDELIYGKFGTSTVFVDTVGFYSIGGFDDTVSQSMNDVEKLGYVAP